MTFSHVFKAKSEAELLEMPIDVVICADTRHVVIRITDLARGIPRHVGSQIWSSLGVKNWKILGGFGEVLKFDLFFVDDLDYSH